MNEPTARVVASQRIERIVTLLTVFLPLVATVGAVFLFWSRGVSWLEVGLCVVM